MTVLLVVAASIVVAYVSTRTVRVARTRRRTRRVDEARVHLPERVDDIVARAESLDALVESLGNERGSDTDVWDAIGAHHEWLLRATRDVHRIAEAPGIRKTTDDLERALLRFDLEASRSRALSLRKPAPDDDRCRLAIAAVRGRSSELLETARFTHIVAHTEC